jgi:hypothetical protein
MTEPKSQEPKTITVPPYTRKDGTKVDGYSYTRYSGVLGGVRPVLEAGEELVQRIIKTCRCQKPRRFTQIHQW